METVRAKAKSFQVLIVWKKAHDFVLAVYVVTRLRRSASCWNHTPGVFCILTSNF